MLVAERGLRAGVAEAVHQLLGAGAGAGREGASEMAKVVKVDIVEAELAAGVGPRLLKDVGCERSALDAGEDVAVVARLARRRRRGPGGRRAARRDRHGAAAGVGLGRADELERLAAELALLLDRDTAASRSRSERRMPSISPLRRPTNAASSTRHRSRGRRRRRACTPRRPSGSGASSAGSMPAPLMVQGLATSRPSSTAVAMIVRSNR